MWIISVMTKGRSPEEKCSILDFFQLTSPPLFPNLDNLYNFFSDVEIQDLKVSLGLRILLFTRYTIDIFYNLKTV